MIKLNSDKEQILLLPIERDKIICFRYITLIFSFHTSPFILLYILRHHAQQFPDDPCMKMLKNNFHMDNLCKTSNFPEELHDLYKELGNRLWKGGFNLRSCNLNCDQFKNKWRRTTELFFMVATWKKS